MNGHRFINQRDGFGDAANVEPIEEANMDDEDQASPEPPRGKWEKNS